MFLKTEREALEKWLPGLDERLRSIPFEQLERPGNPSIDLFRRAGGSALQIPTELGGRGARLVDVVRVQRALGSRSPSLAVAATMHTFTAAALVEYNARSDNRLALLLANIAGQNLLLASGFAEGRAGVSAMDTNMEAVAEGDEFVVSGSKKPCSLAHSMDLFTAHVMVTPEERRAYLIMPAAVPGIERKPFWIGSVLGGAESDEVILNEVRVPKSWLIYADEPGIAEMETWGGACFQLLVSASYLGAASGLLERALPRKVPGTMLVAAASELESAMAAIEGVAYSFLLRERADPMQQSLFVRYGVQGAIERASMLAAELLGGMAYMSSPELCYLLSAGRGLAYHPPSRLSWTPWGVNWLRGPQDDQQS
jgi:alkylation response protein AidB-like acyl-CoA dehydrogenase